MRVVKQAEGVVTKGKKRDNKKEQKKENKKDETTIIRWKKK